MKRILLALVFLGATLSLLIGTPALSSRVSGLTKALEQLPPENLEEVLENLGVSSFPAPVPKTGATYDVPSARGDDGELQMGVVWPVPRFTDNGNGTVTDNLTGLVWTKKADIFVYKTWDAACLECYELNSGEGGLSDGSQAGDWRLPNIRELQSLIRYDFYYPGVPNTEGTGEWTEGDPFTGVMVSDYWSSTPFSYDLSGFWYVELYSGVVKPTFPVLTKMVWCVRDSK